MMGSLGEEMVFPPLPQELMTALLELVVWCQHWNLNPSSTPGQSVVQTTSRMQLQTIGGNKVLTSWRFPMDFSMATGLATAFEASSLAWGPYSRPVHPTAGVFGVGGWVLLLIPRTIVLPLKTTVERMALPPDGCNVALQNCAEGKMIGARLPRNNTARGRSDEMAASSAASENIATDIGAGSLVTGAMPLVTSVCLKTTSTTVTEISDVWPDISTLEPGTKHMGPKTSAGTFAEVLETGAGIQRINHCGGPIASFPLEAGAFSNSTV